MTARIFSRPLSHFPTHFSDGKNILTTPFSFLLSRKARKSHVSLSVSTASDWSDHEKAIVAFIQKYEVGIALAKSKGIAIEFDVAIEPEDYQKKTLFGLQLSRGLVDTLAKLQASIDISIYLATSE
jgi:hypothetical protein